MLAIETGHEGARIDARPVPVPVGPPRGDALRQRLPWAWKTARPANTWCRWRVVANPMLDDPERTSRLLAALEAALPFEVHLTPPLARLLRERRVVLPAGDLQTVSGVSYPGDEGGIVCHIVPPDGGRVAFVSLTHVRVPPPIPLVAEVLRYRKPGSRSSGSRARAQRKTCSRAWPARSAAATTRRGRRTAMDVETAIRAFASAGHDLPREAMRWALDHWDEARPACSGCWSGTPRRGPVGGGRGCGLLHPPPRGREAGDARVRPLCRLLRDAEALGGAGRRRHHHPLADPDQHLRRRPRGAEGRDRGGAADEYARAGALEVLAYLAATGRVAREEAEAYLLRLHDALRPRHESFVWSGWVLAVGLLGLEVLSDVVRRAFERGLVDPTVMGYEHFREDLRRTLADPERMAGFRHDNIAPLEDAVGELSRWYAFSDGAERDRARRSQVTAFDPPPRGRPSIRTSTSAATTLARAAAGRSQEVLPAPGVDPLGGRLAVSASTLTRRDPRRRLQSTSTCRSYQEGLPCRLTRSPS